MGETAGKGPWGRGAEGLARSIAVSQTTGLQQCPGSPGGPVFSLPDSQPPPIEQQQPGLRPLRKSVGPIGKSEGIYSNCRPWPKVLSSFSCLNTIQAAGQKLIQTAPAHPCVTSFFPFLGCSWPSRQVAFPLPQQPSRVKKRKQG